MEENANENLLNVSSTKYPPPPVKPSDDDCCGSGCPTCVFDLYELELSKWRRRCEEIDNGLDEQSVDDVISVYEYKEFRLMKIEQISKKIVYFTFEIPNHGKLPIKSGQHLVVRYSKTVKVT